MPANRSEIKTGQKADFTHRLHLELQGCGVVERSVATTHGLLIDIKKLTNINMPSVDIMTKFLHSK